MRAGGAWLAFCWLRAQSQRGAEGRCSFQETTFQQPPGCALVPRVVSAPWEELAHDRKRSGEQ